MGCKKEDIDAADPQAIDGGSIVIHSKQGAIRAGAKRPRPGRPLRR